MGDSEEAEKVRLETLAGLVKQRQFARGYVTRTGNVLWKLCDDKTTELPALQSAKSKFDEKISKLEDIQEQIEMFLSEK